MLEVRDHPQGDIVEYLTALIWGKFNPKLYGLGSFSGNKLLGGFLYGNYKEIADGQYSIEMHMAGQPGWLSRSALRAFFAYPFEYCRCSRVIGPVLRSNEHSANVTKRFGFTLDGIIRSGIAPEHDLMIWTMTRDECPWLR